MFFSESWMSLYEEEIKEVRFKEHPLKMRQGPFGYMEDLDGNKWDANGYMYGCVLLRPVVGDDPWYSTSTNMFPSGLRKWIPYKVIIEEK